MGFSDEFHEGAKVFGASMRVFDEPQGRCNFSVLERLNVVFEESRGCNLRFLESLKVC